ncbi:MAG TPA: hypothetical protein ENK57_15120 [Polyangiaceae bacterium]|nr:hypothetical protein [Polyangiaceae bacterium]
MAHKHQFLRKIGTAALGAALAFGLGSLSASASTGGGDCIDATCGGVKSCKKLKRACSYGGRDLHGEDSQRLW